MLLFPGEGDPQLVNLGRGRRIFKTDVPLSRMEPSDLRVDEKRGGRVDIEGRGKKIRIWGGRRANKEK